MPNLLDLWNQIKKVLDGKSSKKFPRERQIWLAHLGKNVGREINGKNEKFWRPVLVLRIASHETCVVLPMTSRDKKGDFCFKLREKSTILFHQIRTIDRKRFIRHLDTVDKKTFHEIQQKIGEFLLAQKPASGPEGKITNRSSRIPARTGINLSEVPRGTRKDPSETRPNFTPQNPKSQ